MKYPEQMTFDENSNWFPHPLPNNKWIGYIAYTSDEKQNHPFGKNVKLRLMDIKLKPSKILHQYSLVGQELLTLRHGALK